MNPIIPLYVYTANFTHDRVETLKDSVREKRERGASGAEYVGLIVLAALIVGGIVWAFKQTDFSNKVKEAIDSLLGGKDKELNKK